ncbi:hypothetical protein [Muribaculum intestinale]|uniref:hypothetical protein n=3 Tax=Muribaculaceae TaxID=2005473 RepID=UPI0025A561C0|nr:hypothetical protein [Muribaculum intestinale]
MLHSKNFADSIKAIKQYVEAGDYSRPHIIASEMYYQRLERFLHENKRIPGDKDELRPYSWVAPSFAQLPETMKCNTEHFFIIPIGRGRGEELKEVLSLPIASKAPWFIYIEDSLIREWGNDVDCDINFYDFDREEWLKASEEINPATGRREIDRFYLDFLKQAPDEFIFFYPPGKHTGMTCNIPNKWEYASYSLIFGIKHMLESAVRANGHKGKPEEIAPLVEPMFNSLFTDGDIDWNKLSDTLEALPEDVWKKSILLPGRLKEMAGNLSRVDQFKLHAIHELNCVTQNVYAALQEFHGLPAAK